MHRYGRTQCARFFYMREYCKKIIIIVALALSAWIVPLYVYARGVYQQPEAFLHEVYNGKPPLASKLWIKKDLGKEIYKILGHNLDVLRIRYWQRNGRTVWILDEIGKEQPITVGIAVAAGRIELVKILIFRETRGWEIRYPFFTDQFKHVMLDQDHKLEKGIDGISGATLSVNAVTKLVRLALLLDKTSHHVGQPINKK